MNEKKPGSNCKELPEPPTHRQASHKERLEYVAFRWGQVPLRWPLTPLKRLYWQRFLNALRCVLRCGLPSCREATRQISEAQDGVLPALQLVRMKAHLSVCRWCRRYEQHIRFLRRAFRHPRLESQNPDNIVRPLSAQARDRLKRTLKSQVSRNTDNNSLQNSNDTPSS